jgi:hypothetical protein
VVTADGRPAAGAIVSVVWGTAATPEIGIVADAAGRFRVALPPGRFRLQADASGARGTAEIEVADSTPEIAITLAAG